MEKQEMIDFLKARGLFERGMKQLVGWELAELVEEAMEAGVPTKEEEEEIEELTKPKAKVKPKAKPKAKPKPKKAKA
jgi:hypothetical protein